MRVGYCFDIIKKFPFPYKPVVLVLRVLEALDAEHAGEVDPAVLAAVRRLAVLEQLPALRHHVAEEGDASVNQQ